MSDERSRERLRAALEALDPSEIEHLVQDAREQARERVLSLLTDALTDTMLDRVCDLLSGARDPQQSRPPVDEQPAAAVGLPELGWYVYGVIRAGGSTAAANLPGVDPQYPTSVLEHGELAAVVSRVVLDEFGEEPLREHLSDLGWLERTARSHELALEQIGSDHTLIPMRMCTVYRSASGVLEMLGREADALSAALRQLDQKAEWGVKVFADPNMTVPVAAVAGQPDEGRHGTDYMRHRRLERKDRDARDARVEEACQGIHDRLREIAVDALISAPQRPEVSGHPGDMVLNGVYLVHDDDRERFSASVDALRSEFGPLALDLVLTGPWPAYNFVPGTIGAAW